MEESHIIDEAFEAEVGQLLADEAEKRRPDRRGPRGNQPPDDDDVERGRDKLDRLL
jgi:hypothetical protein